MEKKLIAPWELMKLINPEGTPMEFSNDGKVWVQRKLIAIGFFEERPYKTEPLEGAKKQSVWRMMREAAVMTVEEAERKFGIKIKVD